jgi:ATP-dependent DNA helicase RecG
LGDNRRKILEKIKNNSTVSIEELSKEIGISSTAIENNLKYLKENDYIERVGSPKDGYWKLKKEDIS